MAEGGGSAGNGWGFDGEIHPLSGRFDRVPLLGGQDVCFFLARETGTKFQRVYIASSIFFGKGVEFGVKCSTITLNKFVCIVTFYTAMMMQITHHVVSLGRLSL